MQLREYAGPFTTQTPDLSLPGSLAWSAYGASGSHIDSDNATGYFSQDLTGLASLAHALYLDDGAIPTLSTIQALVVKFTLGEDSLFVQGALGVLPYIRFADGPPAYQELLSPPYSASFADYEARFPRDPNGLPWTRATIYRLRGEQLLAGLRTAPSDLVSARIQWSECRWRVEFLLPIPLVTTDPASLISDVAAQLNGRINPRSANASYPLTYWFEWGTSITYGNSTTPIGAITGEVDLNITTNLTGLVASTGYHYRLVASTLDGTYYGEDRYFTSAATGIGRWRLNEFKRVPTGSFNAGDRTRETSQGFDIPSTSTDDFTCPFLEFP